MWKDFNDNLVPSTLIPHGYSGLITRPAGAGIGKFRNAGMRCWKFDSRGVQAISHQVFVTDVGLVRWYVGMSADGSEWFAVEARLYPIGYAGVAVCPSISFLSDSAVLSTIGYSDIGGFASGATYDKSAGKLFLVVNRAGTLARIECPVGVSTDHDLYAGFGADAACGTVSWNLPAVYMLGNSKNQSNDIVDCNKVYNIVGYSDATSPCYADTLTGIGLSSDKLGWTGSGITGVGGAGVWATTDTTATWSTPNSKASSVTRYIIIDDCDNEITVTIAPGAHPTAPGNPFYGMTGGLVGIELKFAAQSTTETVTASNLPPGPVEIHGSINYPGFTDNDNISSGVISLSGHGWHVAEAC